MCLASYGVTECIPQVQTDDRKPEEGGHHEKVTQVTCCKAEAERQIPQV